MNLAVIATVHFPYSHADVITTRWLTPRESDRLWGWSGPRTRIVSCYFDQFGPDDIAKQVWPSHDIPIFPTIREALTLGGIDLAVEGVLLIGEHGAYPINSYGQKLYPRKEFFHQIVDVFITSRRTAPVFCDKHFSWDYSTAQEMVTCSRRLDFLLFGGSSIPHCHYLPNPDFSGQEIEEIVCVYHRPLESYAFHVLELVQSLVEGRQGGETGLRAVTAWIGDDYTQVQQTSWWPSELIDAAIDVQPVRGADYGIPSYRDDDEPDTPSMAWTLEYNDGLRVTYVRDKENPHGGFSAALRRKGTNDIEALVPLLGTFQAYVPHFACLAQVIEEAFLSGTPPFPIERTLLTTGMLQSMMHATKQSGQKLLTPHLYACYSFSERREIPVLSADELATHPSCE